MKSLQDGDPDAWDAVFKWLWPGAVAVAQLKLAPFLPGEVDDVAIEALEALVERVRLGKVATVEGLKPEVASIAHNRAVSLLRERFAKKRGEGKTIPLDQPSDPSDDASPAREHAAEVPALDNLGQTELADLLSELQRDLKPEFQSVLGDFFFHGLNYQQIATKHKVALGTVGVYLKRGLDALRKAGQRRPQLLKELEAFLR
jgi:RNA polymerase sigma factor (sigma-70 family)